MKARDVIEKLSVRDIEQNREIIVTETKIFFPDNYISAREGEDTCANGTCEFD